MQSVCPLCFLLIYDQQNNTTQSKSKNQRTVVAVLEGHVEKIVISKGHSPCGFDLGFSSKPLGGGLQESWLRAKQLLSPEQELAEDLVVIILITKCDYITAARQDVLE